MKHEELRTWEQTRQLNIEVAQLAMMQARELTSGVDLQNDRANEQETISRKRLLFTPHKRERDCST